MSTATAPIKLASTLTDKQLARGADMYMRGVTAAIRAKGGPDLLTKSASQAKSMREQAENHIIAIHLLGDVVKKRADVL